MKKNISLLMVMLLVSGLGYSESVLEQQYQKYLKDKLMIQSGFFGSHQGQEQHIPINNLNGDKFTVSGSSDINALIGLGYYNDLKEYSKLKLQYGLNVLYFIQTKVSGQVIQENIFNNLSYSYNVSHVPFYFSIKAITETHKSGYSLYLDGGIGPNVIVTSGFNEKPENNFSIPQNIFTGATHTNFSAMAGVGVRATDILSHPLECGYRFMYLGKGQLNINNTEVLNPLSTGQIYAHSLVCGLVI